MNFKVYGTFGRLRCILICFYTVGIIFLTGCSRKEETAFGYQIPLEEIAERLEYEYVYENMIGQIADYDYKQLSFLPSGKDIPISVYVVREEMGGLDLTGILGGVE